MRFPFEFTHEFFFFTLERRDQRRAQQKCFSILTNYFPLPGVAESSTIIYSYTYCVSIEMNGCLIGSNYINFIHFAHKLRAHIAQIQ